MAQEAWIGKWGPKNNQYFSTAVPSTNDGTQYNVGDVCWNTAPSGGGAPGWVCTAAGNGATSTWKAMGNLAA